MPDLSMGPLGPDPLVRSYERHLHAEARSAARVTTYLIAVRQADAFDEAYPSNPLDSAESRLCPSLPLTPLTDFVTGVRRVPREWALPGALSCLVR
jgi:hypothetical protein